MKFFFALCCFLTTAMIFPELTAGEWFTDFEKAKAESMKTKRPIYILFTKSDAPADRNYERVIFSQQKFQDYADKNLVLMKADFPTAIHLQQKWLQQQNRELRTKYSISVLPTALLLDANGELCINFVKEDGGAEKHRRKLNEIMDFNAPKRYADYLDGFVKKYTPPEPPAKKTEAKNTDARASEKAKKEAEAKAAAEKAAENAETNIPDENAGSPLIPLNPEGDLQEWLKSGGLLEEAKEAEPAEAVKEETEPSEASEASAKAPEQQPPAPAGK